MTVPLLPGVLTTPTVLPDGYGAVEIQYAADVAEDALLEALPTGSVVAWLHFRTGDGAARQTFTITTQEPARRLVFGASTPLSFEMDKGWDSYWE